MDHGEDLLGTRMTTNTSLTPSLTLFFTIQCICSQIGFFQMVDTAITLVILHKAARYSGMVASPTRTFSLFSLLITNK